MSKEVKKCILCSRCKKFLCYEKDIGTKTKKWLGDPIKKEPDKEGIKCESCQEINSGLSNFYYYCEIHKTVGEECSNVGQPCFTCKTDYNLHKFHNCDKCKEEEHNELEKNKNDKDRNLFIKHFEKLNKDKFALGNWKHCNKEFASLEDFISHLKFCSDIPKIDNWTVSQSNCKKCGKTTTYDKYFEQSHPHKCQVNISQLEREWEEIRQYMILNDVKIIKLDNEQLKVIYKSKKQEQLEKNNPWYDRIRNFLISNNQNEINTNQSPIGEGIKKNLSIYLLIIGIICLIIGILGLIWTLRKNNDSD